MSYIKDLIISISGLGRKMNAGDLFDLRNTAVHQYCTSCVMQESSITKDKADDFKHSIQLPRTLLKTSVIVLLCVSGKQLMNECLLGFIIGRCSVLVYARIVVL